MNRPCAYLGGLTSAVAGQCGLRRQASESLGRLTLGHRTGNESSKSPSGVRMGIARNTAEATAVPFDFSFVFQLRDTCS